MQFRTQHLTVAVMPALRRVRRERGSALLIVLVFAAIIAILLYRELPIAAFEAQRQKEHLLISRGNQYKRGVKLFVRKVGRFPSSIDEMENTNRMRFLRHRFTDPFTGKDDWRMIHAGPGGIILDSKVASNNNGPKGTTLGQGATFAGFNNSFSGDTAATAALAAENTPSAGMRQRPPATKNAAGDSPLDPLAVIAGTANPPSSDPNSPATATGAPNNADGTQAQQTPATTAQAQSANGAAPPPSTNGINTLADQLNNVNPRVPEQAPATATGTQTAGQTGLSNTSAFGNLTGNGNQGPNQITAGGGIAGVASNAEGKSIKLVHDQKKYKLWEFYYDMRAEQTQGAANALGQPGTNPNGAANPNGSTNSTNSAFGQNQSSFTTGSSFSTGSSFGNSPGVAATPTQPTTTPTAQQP